MSNLGAIGFRINTQEELEELIQAVYPVSEKYEGEGGSYFRYSDPSGAELWLQTDTRLALLGFNPHFNGQSRRRVRLTDSYAGDMSPLDGAYHAWSNPQEDNEGDYPLVFDLPDFKLAEIRQFPEDVIIQLTAFGQQVMCYADAKAFQDAQTGKSPFASESFVPLGLFDAATEGEDAVPRANALLAGTVLRSERLTNTLTGQSFIWALVRTMGGEIDVLLDPAVSTEQPTEGGIIFGEFWLSARVMGSDGELKML